MGKKSLLILTFFCILVSQVSDASIICKSGLFVRRSGSDGCWVRYKIDKDTSLCFSRLLWFEYLRSEKLLSSCSSYDGKWRVFSPPYNGEKGRKKTVFSSFYVSEIKGQAISGVFSRAIFISIKEIENIREKLAASITPGDSLGLFRKLILDQNCPGCSIDFLRTIGFVHLVSASGIHLYSVMSFSRAACFTIGRFFGFPVGVTRLLAVLLSTCAWGFLWLLSGMRAGLLRPIIIVTFRSVALSVGCRWRSFSPLIIALGFDLLAAVFFQTGGLNDGVEWAPGRLHYALAVGGGLLAIEMRRSSSLEHNSNRITDVVKDHLALAVGSWLFTAVYDAWSTGLIAFATPVLSLLTIPVFCSVVYPCVVFSAFMRFFDFNTFDSVVIGYSSNYIYWLADLTARTLSLWVVDGSVVIFALMAAALLLLYSLHGKSYLFAVAVLVIVVSVRALSGSQITGIRARAIEQLDVGQGDSALVFGGDDRIGLIDTGSSHALKEDAWLRLLARRGITNLSWVALTHSDEDHTGGLKRLGNIAQISCIVSKTTNESCFPYKYADLLHSGKRNSEMRAFLIPLNDRQIYVSLGDANQRQEEQAIHWILREGRLGEKNASARVILKISHHGSNGSTSPKLLNRIRPSEVWISAGLGNRFHHPALKTLLRLERARESFGLKIRRTDIEGGIRPGFGQPLVLDFTGFY
ncbi:MAG: hypothetical protein A3K03_07910 [Bdellovibrionales bacterium RIFOXYD1_FULL_44_7]|nr:MAG: hypothetical protein A3K03_07910 [Bdellovibrionales bacterium RIFOXYD1_FULL_44_7]